MRVVENKEITVNQLASRVRLTPLRVSRTPEVALAIYTASGQVPTVAQIATRLRLSPFDIIGYMRERGYEMVDFCPCPEDE